VFDKDVMGFWHEVDKIINVEAISTVHGIGGLVVVWVTVRLLVCGTK